jgi:HSP20 family protein
VTEALVDDQFPSAIRYLDELYRHFSNHHQNRFIPRFDLTEDDHFYYLCGELPGAKADYITIEPSNDHTLRIYGTIPRLNSGLPSPDQNSHTCKETEVQVNKVNDTVSSPPADKGTPFQSRHIRLPFHHHPVGDSREGNRSNTLLQPHQGILLSERLVGNFHRKFDFLMPVEEEAIKANLENGLLTLLLPKKVQCRDLDKPRTIPIVEIH